MVHRKQARLSTFGLVAKQWEEEEEKVVVVVDLGETMELVEKAREKEEEEEEEDLVWMAMNLGDLKFEEDLFGRLKTGA